MLGYLIIQHFLLYWYCSKKLNKYIIMEANVNKLVNVDVFKHKNEVELSSLVNEFLGDAGDSISFINSSITYNTDTEEAPQAKNKKPRRRKRRKPSSTNNDTTTQS